MRGWECGVWEEECEGRAYASVVGETGSGVENAEGVGE